jgi:DNA adenine methylase
MTGTFSYPGSKVRLSDWIINHLPAHEVYVEPFGGSAGVLANKPESQIEVYNDTASLCVDFFRALKNHPDELERWVQTTPHSRELYNEYIQKLEHNRPDDLVSRAGMFWYTQFTSFSSKGVLSESSEYFSVNTTPASRQNFTEGLKDAADAIGETCERFRKVQIEHMDFETLFEKYDGDTTVFYCDPPYADVGDSYYQTGEDGFNHSRFVNALTNLTGYWVVSYDHQIPDGLSEYHTVSKSKRSRMDNKRTEKTESLIMNYDPTETRLFCESNQNDLEQYQ